MLKKWFRKKEPAEAQKAGEVEDAEVEDAEELEEKQSAWATLKRGLQKTRRGLSSLFTLRRKLDDDFVEELEAELYAADFGPSAVAELMDGESGVRQAWKEKRIETAGEVREYLKAHLKEILRRRENHLVLAETPPTTLLVAGVNGTGKTTSIAKIAHRLRSEDQRVILAAADTFRAAAVEQLTVWSERLGVEIVTGKPGADPGSVAYRAAEKAVEEKADFLIVDTAGRLHTQKNLMRELTKIRSVLGKKIPGAPHESLLVLDATTGQNAISQAQTFLEAIQVTGIVLAKLDGTAKGGIVVTVNNRFEIPVKFVGVGERLEDLQHFDPDAFVDALLEE
jgi:fused signal recognition particle receptor